jgi:hypothetical protein
MRGMEDILKELSFQNYIDRFLEEEVKIDSNLFEIILMNFIN